MRIAHFSDSHISIQHPARLDDLRRAVDEVNASQPDLVIHTGDITHDAHVQEYQQAHAILESLHVPYFVIPGNRDQRAVLLPVFKKRLSTTGEYIQYTLEDFAVRILLLDTVSTASNKGQLCVERLAHAIAVLEQEDPRPLLVFMHHTPFDVMEIPDPFQFEDRAAVEKLTAAFGRCRNLRAIYCGHVHRNVQATIGHLPVSAITCMACDLRKGQLSEEDKTRPMYRILEW